MAKDTEIPDAEKTADDWADLPDVIILKMTMVAMLVCVKDGTSTEEIERVADREQPTGIGSSWVIDSEEPTKSCPDGRPGATHYVLCC